MEGSQLFGHLDRHRVSICRSVLPEVPISTGVGPTAFSGSLCRRKIVTGTLGRSTFEQLEVPRAR
jgi:hypothetical protein